MIHKLVILRYQYMCNFPGTDLQMVYGAQQFTFIVFLYIFLIYFYYQMQR